MLIQSQHLWQPPRELPDLRRVDIVSIDTETNDAGLQAKRGSSWPWRDGHVCGIPVAWHEGGDVRAIYVPLRHPDSENFDTAQVYRWLADLIASSVRIVGHNTVYDFGWLGAEGGIKMPPSNRLEETGALAALVDENLQRYSLDALCAHYGLPGKDEALLAQAVEALLASGPASARKKKVNLQEHIHRLPARFVGPYAEKDPIATLALYEKLDPVLDREKTRDAYRLEVDLLPMVLEMRRRGNRIDQDRAVQAYDLLIGKRDAALQEISKELGSAVSMTEIRGKKWLKKAFDGYGIKYPLTPKGNPSFSSRKSGWMAEHEHWLPRGIAVANRYNHAGETFIRGHILNHIVNGRIHGDIRPHLSDEGGTISFRFSYSHPPLQQMPKRDDETGPLIRSCFLSEESEFWATADASQQEFRGWVHYGVERGLPSALEAAKAYRDNLDTDFHELVGEMTGLGRGTAKTANFAKGYGSGVKTFAKTIGKSVEEAAAIMAQYDARLPFVKQLFHIEQEKATRTGFTRLYDGALRHWNLYAPAWQDHLACPFEEARRRVADPSHPWHRQELRRAGTRKAFNALVHGLGARHTKLWMRAVYQQTGIIPLLQMHDALKCSVAGYEQAELVARLGCEAVTLHVPMKVDVKFGRNWGDATHSWEELTGDSAPAKPIKPITATVIPIRPGIVVPRKPAIVIPIDYATALVQPTTAPPPSPPPPDDTAAEIEIDLADLVNCPVPKSCKICCPFHGETKPSMHIYLDHYYCYGCHAWGDHVDWLVKVEGLEYGQALDIIDNWDGPVVERSETRDAEEDARRTAYALQWWNGAQPLPGSLAARYLADVRGIDLDVLPNDISERALRFHPDCVFGSGIFHPCLLALMRDPISGAPAGIHRTALTSDARKIDRKMLGPTGVVQLWPAGSQLVLAEGLETTLAAATRLPYREMPLRPAWATLSDGAMARFPVIDGIARLILLADNDANRSGHKAAEACKRRWLEAGRRVAVLTPDRPGTDFNDIVLESLRCVS